MNSLLSTGLFNEWRVTSFTDRAHEDLEVSSGTCTFTARNRVARRYGELSRAHPEGDFTVWKANLSGATLVFCR